MAVVVSGAGAAGAVIAKLLMGQEVDPDVSGPVKDVVVCDSRWAIHQSREDLSPVSLKSSSYSQQVRSQRRAPDLSPRHELTDDLRFPEWAGTRGDRMATSQRERLIP